MTEVLPRQFDPDRSFSSDLNLEPAVHSWGSRIFALMDREGARSGFGRKRLYGALMNWAMADAQFKTRLFRFIDVLPSLSSSAAIAQHLQEYLSDDQVELSPPLRLALKASARAPWLLGQVVKRQVSQLARQFMVGNTANDISAALRARAVLGLGFTIDILGETVVSEAEADTYAARCLWVLDLLARQRASFKLPHPERWTGVPGLNLSVKISALYSQINPADPETAIAKILERLRPILRRAKEIGALVNFDMEQRAVKDLTLRLFKTTFAEGEFAEQPACGLAIQAYLKDSSQDLTDLLDWAHHHDRAITVRLVKGAYWDYERVIAAQKGWSVPVFAHKSETDANFERLSTLLLQNAAIVQPAFGTHNVRSIAHAIAESERLGVPPATFEFQMLYGMADSAKTALTQLGFRVREYCPAGELITGMAYLVRRLLENTSNEGFLAKNSSRSATHQQLLEAPQHKVGRRVLAHARESIPFVRVLPEPTHELTFHNEPPADFTVTEERRLFRAALDSVTTRLGEHYPLIIDNKPVETGTWISSLNPAAQRQVVGYAAQGSIEHAEAALAAASNAKSSWGRTGFELRANIIERLANLLRRDKAELCAFEILEAGKNWAEADADLAEAIDFCTYYASLARQLAKPEPTQIVPGESNVQHWWPRGVGVVIAPWNFPLAILAGMTVAAVVTGNTVVVKPSDQTPIVAALLVRLMIQAGLPPGVVNLINGPGSTVGAHLVASSHVDFIAFTGSKEVGLKIWETAGKTAAGQSGLKKVICEMGGKNAIIVDSDADLDEAAAGVVASAFGYSGQKCSALSRLIVLADVHAAFLGRLIPAVASLPVGPAADPGTIIGPVISRDAQQRILRAIELGKNEAMLAWQGQVPQDPEACYVPPTIFKDVPSASPLFREEIFGPVLAITKASNFDEALRLANDSEFALTAGIYSRSPGKLDRAKAELICGNLYINRAITGAVVQRQPFGGFKMSGGGTKAGGREYLANFMIPRVVTENCLRRGFAPDVLSA